MRVEICGGIAAGKTTLAKLLAETPVTAIFESFRSNPFWEAFYTEPGLHIFETEITFLLQHYHQLKVAAATTSQFVVADFSFVLDSAYADIGLTGNRRRIFEGIHREVLREIGAPSLVIHIQCEATIELHRIRARARVEEALIDEAFLATLNRAVTKRIMSLGRSTRVVRIDSGKLNFASDKNTGLSVLRSLSGEMQSLGELSSGLRRKRSRARPKKG